LDSIFFAAYLAMAAMVAVSVVCCEMGWDGDDAE
jgi:hypothetical protein